MTTLLYVMIEDVYILINYVSFVEAVFITISVTGLLYMRKTKPNINRPIRVSLVLPVIFFLICAFLVTFPFSVSPIEVGVALIIIAAGIPVYYLTIGWKNKPLCLQKTSDDFNNACAKLFVCMPAEDEKDF